MNVQNSSKINFNFYSITFINKPMEWNKKFTYPRSTRSLINGSRHYSLDGSNLPSVTTILKVTQSEEDKAAIEAWKQRVGHKEANRIKNEASSRGSSMHAYLEKYLLGKFNLDLLDEEERSKKMANEIIDNGLKDKLSEVWGAEATVYFPGKYAGTADCIGIYEGKDWVWNNGTIVEAELVRMKSRIERRTRSRHAKEDALEFAKFLKLL